MKKSVYFTILMMSLSIIACGTDGNGNEVNNTVQAEIVAQAEQDTEAKGPVSPADTDKTESKPEDAKEAEESAATEILEETEVVEEPEEPQGPQPITYEDYNINSRGYSNCIDLYAIGNGPEDEVYVGIWADNCAANSSHPEALSTDTQTYRGIKMGDSKAQVLAAYGEPEKEVVYMNKQYSHDGLEAQYNMCYCYVDERFPEVFFNLAINMDQNDNVLAILYDSILIKWR